MLRIRDADLVQFASFQWDALDAVLAAGWPTDELLSPDKALALAHRSGSTDVRAMARENAWPAVRQVRSHLAVLMYDHGLSYQPIDGPRRLAWPLMDGSAGADDSRVAFVYFPFVTASVATDIAAAADQGYMVVAGVDGGYLGSHQYTLDGVRAMYFDTTDVNRNSLVTVAEVGEFATATGAAWSATHAVVAQQIFASCGDSGSGVPFSAIPCLESQGGASFGFSFTPNLAEINRDPAASVAARDAALAAGAHVVVTRFPTPVDLVTGESRADFHVALEAPYVCNARTAPTSCSVANISAALRGECAVAGCAECEALDTCVVCAAGHGLQPGQWCMADRPIAAAPTFASATAAAAAAAAAAPTAAGQLAAAEPATNDNGRRCVWRPR
ncbi:uncharacterized protein AMSG_03899 [Thecamonas trahens ATCC 50062]|uniref:Uncharacterized protein n=1 Tax=Thecamonas trahens ATCC 50062 TaxID=461836 RepID=A0A0L0D5P5_THETB|nr:hypothetical protein AMSG_03899 [Thecamonas trahens ATCC 50062]KNC47669.1 hypothetical protein AMSG_03899 [Thecamonas trahens ATCC 50062]|eukprot:XP_013759153.1 hypothetical protein AMSG_03899 [Thecamonas trahens ATCC 50062]